MRGSHDKVGATLPEQLCIRPIQQLKRRPCHNRQNQAPLTWNPRQKVKGGRHPHMPLKPKGPWPAKKGTGRLTEGVDQNRFLPSIPFGYLTQFSLLFCLYIANIQSSSFQLVLFISSFLLFRLAFRLSFKSLLLFSCFNCSGLSFTQLISLSIPSLRLSRINT